MVYYTIANAEFQQVRNRVMHLEHLSILENVFWIKL